MKEANVQTIIMIMTVIQVGVSLWKCLRVTNFVKREDGKFPYFTIRNQKEYEAVTAKIEKNSTRLLLKCMFPIFICYVVSNQPIIIPSILEEF
jgi:hypothetical protein